MNYDIAQMAVYCLLIVAAAPFIGWYMAKIYAKEISPVLGGFEKAVYRVCGINPEEEQDWKCYAGALLALNLLGIAVLFCILRFQNFLPFNPQHFPGVGAALAWNTAVSFVSNTNWQAYSGEATLSYFSQVIGLNIQYFVSAATGIAVVVALIRALVRKQVKTIGNFYVDVTRTVLYVLLPLAIIIAIALASQGVPQNLHGYVAADTLEHGQQILPQGPVASQVAIKQLGSNGGGFFGVNSSHPYENPTPLSNLLEMVLLLLLPASLVFMFGYMVRDQRQAWTLFAAMGIVFLVGLGVTYYAEIQANPLLSSLHLANAGENLQGKEVRFGVGNSALWAVATTVTSNGSVNAMHDSFMPLGGLMPLANIMLGEVIFGGVGSGLYGMLVFVLVTVFLAGLMVGRSPEYLGKKVEAREITLCILAMLTMPFGVLGLGALSSILPAGLASLGNAGPHGFSEILYAYSSATGNNGSAFAGFNANTDYQNIMLSIAMLVGRFLFIVPVLAIAGSLVQKKVTPVSSGTFPTHGSQFALLLMGVIVIVGGLTFFPVLTLGPILEHLLMHAGQSF